MQPKPYDQVSRNRKGVTLHYIVYFYLRPQFKVKVNGQLEIFSMVNNQATTSLGSFQKIDQRSSKFSAVKSTIESNIMQHFTVDEDRSMQQYSARGLSPPCINLPV